MIMIMATKILTCCYEASFFTVRKVLSEMYKELIFTTFLDKLRSSLKYCKREIEEFNSTGPPKQLLN